MNSFKSWSVNVYAPKNKDIIEAYLLETAGAVSINTAVEFITPLIEKGMDDVTLVSDEGLYTFIGLEE